MIRTLLVHESKLGRGFLLALGLGLALVLGGCAAFNNLESEVSTYGPWPVNRKPGSYGFERLPSEQAHPERRQMLEDAARGALEGAGFGPATDVQEAEYLIQLAARVSSNDPWIDSNLLFWPGPWRYGYGYPFGYGYGYRPGHWARAPWGFGGGWGWGLGYNSPAYFERDVALLIRDRKTGQLLYEARAGTSGTTPTIETLLAPMFKAALADFPGSSPNPHSITVPLTTP